MDWAAQIDGYCERLGPGLGAEPVNALTNLAFLAIALWLWPHSRGIERVLCAILVAIAAGSTLFHTYATAWAALSDTAPIAAFVLVYVFAANRLFLGQSAASALAGTAGAGAALALAGWGASFVPGLAISAVYWPVPALILGYALVLRRRNRDLALGLVFGAGALALSILLRTIDADICAVLPMGTHFAWHLINAAMLGWMITLLRRHRLEPAGAQRYTRTAGS